MGVWDYVVIDETNTIVNVGTEDECVEWAALTGAERQTTYRVRAWKPEPTTIDAPTDTP